MAAGRCVSSEAISTLRLAVSARRLPIFAVVVVLPEPCSPTIMMTIGEGALRSIGCALAPRVSINWSCTIFTTIWPGVTGLITSTPTARRLPSADANGPLCALLGETAGDIECTIGFEQRAPHFAQRLLDIGFRQRTAPGEPVENPIKAFRKPVEHIYLTAMTPEGASRCRA